MKNLKTGIRLSVIISFLAMILVNVLAETIPINGMTTGQVSALYPNLFTPANYTFSIWMLIYLLLAGYVLYQAGLFHKNSSSHASLCNTVGVYFSVSCLFNICWILAWHYEMIAICLIIIVVLMVCVLQIVQIVREKSLTLKESFFLKLPFSVYFAWLTIAVIGNMTVYLVSLEWDGFNKIEPIWTIVVLLAGLAIGLKEVLKNNDATFGFVYIWSYTGILVKHVSSSGFNGQYPGIITVLIVSIILFVPSSVYVFITSLKRRHK